MVNNIFKALYLVVLVCFVFVLFGIYQQLDNGRFQITDNNVVLDTKTGKIYLHNTSLGGYIKLKKGKEEKDDWYESLKITELPR